MAKTTAYKDKPELYNAFLKQADIAESDFPFLHYIRKVIALADILDIMRCTSHFKISELIKHFKDMTGYIEEVHKPLITQLTTEAYQIILKQHDMLFRCFVLDTDGVIIHASKGSYSLRHKVAFEHANNACSAVSNYISAHAYFKPYFTKDFSKQEFRTFTPLQIGIEISVVATNSKANQKTINKFFKDHGIKVKIILFEDLEHRKHHTCSAASDIKYPRNLKSSIALGGGGGAPKIVIAEPPKSSNAVATSGPC